MSWRYDLPAALIAEHMRKAELRETCTITINLLVVLGMVFTAWVMLELVGNHPSGEEDLVLMRGDNVAAVTWVVKCGRAREKRAGEVTSPSTSLARRTYWQTAYRGGHGAI